MKSVCIVIATKNAERTLGKCLKSIFEQDFPKKLLEVILVDGGSTDKTLAIAKKFSLDFAPRRARDFARDKSLDGSTTPFDKLRTSLTTREMSVKVIVRPELSSEAAKAVGLLKTRKEFYCDIAADNYLPNRNWLRDLMAPLNKDSSLAGSYPERYLYRKGDSLLNRYFALLGVNDPIARYLGKADRRSYLSEEWDLMGKVVSEDKTKSVVEFDCGSIPTLGANGFFIKRSLLLKADIKNFYHIDVVADLLSKRKLRFAVVKMAIGHDTGENLESFLVKRRRYLEKLYIKNRSKRRYHLYEKRDFGKLFWFVIFSLTLVQPLTVSLKGFRKIRDVAWFIHPVVCFLTVFNYGFVMALSSLRRRI